MFSVALNYQTGTDPMQLNRGRFLDNGSCGYVLKPNFLLAEEMFGIVNGTVVRNTRKTLRLTVSAQNSIYKINCQLIGFVQLLQIYAGFTASTAACLQ